MLEQASEKRRVDRRADAGPAVKKTLELKPKAYWRLDEFAGPRAIDSSPNGIDALIEPRVLFYLPGPKDAAFAEDGINRSVHLAGDRISARIPGMTGNDYTVSLWFWSGTSGVALEGTESLFARGAAYGNPRDFIGLGVTEGRRVLRLGGTKGTSDAQDGSIERWKWHHLVISRQGEQLGITLDGQAVAVSDVPSPSETAPDTFFFGGSPTGEGNFEGRLDEIAVFDRALSEDEITTLFQAGAGE
jgi:hypothetical protein